MSINRVLLPLVCLVLVISSTLQADSPTPSPAPDGSMILTNLRMDIDKKTDTVHLISTVNDPDIVTKVYLLKHADPYELRPYLRTAVGAKMINGAPTDTWVECIKYNDGTGFLVVSAEDYRFTKEGLKKQGASDDCMSIDCIIKMLDQPNITSSSGSARFIYFPEYRSAQQIMELTSNVGLDMRGDISTLIYGVNMRVVDKGLNAVIFHSPKYNIKNIEEMVEVYDQALPEVKVDISVHEIATENDRKLGVDFQAWKNGPGADLFSVAARFAQGMSTQGIPNATGWGGTKFVQLSPRWNSRFIDFLTARSKSKTVVDATLIIRNNELGYLENTTRIPNFTDGTPIADRVLLDYEDIRGAWYVWGNAGAGVGVTNIDEYTIRAADSKGTMITISANFTGTIRVGRASDTGDATASYTLQMVNSPGAFFIKNGKNVGSRVDNCYNLEIMTNTAAAFTAWQPYTSQWATDKNFTVQKNFMRDTQISSYGFNVSVVPTVCRDTTVLDVRLQNTSLLGFTENANGAAGAARTSMSEFRTKLMVNNRNERFMIGGVEKVSLVQSVSKVPWLGSLPIIGYLLGSESTVVKKSQLVTMVTCQHQTPIASISGKIYGDIREIKKDLKAAPNQYNLGFDQFHLDPNKTSLDELP